MPHLVNSRKRLMKYFIADLLLLFINLEVLTLVGSYAG